jgi:hypothetical protein
MLERTDAITNDVLEPITVVLAYPIVRKYTKTGSDKMLLQPQLHNWEMSHKFELFVELKSWWLVIRELMLIPQHTKFENKYLFNPTKTETEPWLFQTEREESILSLPYRSKIGASLETGCPHTVLS